MNVGTFTRIFSNGNLLKRCFSTSSTKTAGDKWYYRVPPDPPPKGSVYAAEVFGGFAWWWVLWHLWTEPEHIYGAFPLPDARTWTDEELGIPPDVDD